MINQVPQPQEALVLSLAQTHPEIAGEWHPSRNRLLTPEVVGAGEHRFVWWRCDKSFYHQWCSSIVARTEDGELCPFCSKEQTQLGESLAAKAPHLIPFWHSLGNRGLSPWWILPSSTYVADWKCTGDGSLQSPHFFLMSVAEAYSNGLVCPRCTGQVDTESLEPLRMLPRRGPKRASNQHLKRTEIKAKSFRKSASKKSKRHIESIKFRLCPQDPEHNWSVGDCEDAGECPECLRLPSIANCSLEALRPDIAREWHPQFNGNLKPSHFLPDSGKSVWWQCSVNKEHVWRSVISEAVGRRVNCRQCEILHCRPQEKSLAYLHPDKARQWFYARNGDITPFMVTPGSGREFWWQCLNNPEHVYCRAIREHVKYDCLQCNQLERQFMSSLSTVEPQLSKEWHKTLNGSFTPNNVSAFSRKSVWWQCSNSHVWSTSPSMRHRIGKNCPYCSNKSGHARNYPYIFEQWDYGRNIGLFPDKIEKNSEIKVWWQCCVNVDHQWQSSFKARISSQVRCPICHENQKHNK